jgi:hypothetical protein
LVLGRIKFPGAALACRLRRWRRPEPKVKARLEEDPAGASLQRGYRSPESAAGFAVVSRRRGGSFKENAGGEGGRD